LKNKKKRLKLVIIMSFIATLPFHGFAETADIPFSVGEKLRYSIHAAGFYVGRQTIELKEMAKLAGVDVYTLYGLSKTSPFVSIFYRLNDKWLIFMEKSTLLPMRIEKDMVEGKSKGFIIYDIDQDIGTVVIQNKTTNKNKTVHAENIVFDLFSLIYYYRKDPSLFNNLFTFDFLEPKNVQTVQFRNEGEENIIVPKISKTKKIPALKLKQVGGVGIEIYVGNDNLRLPLKMVVPSKLPRKKRLIIEFCLEKYSPGKEHEDIPSMYKRLSF